MRKSELLQDKARLSAELAHYKGIVDSAGPYLPLAESLQNRVADRLSQVGQDDLDRVFAETISGREDELVRLGIEAKIEALPPERLLGMYACLLGDDSVNAPLKRIAAVKHAEMERQARLAELKQEALVSGSFDMSRAIEGEIVEIGLLLGVRRFKNYEEKDSAGRIITARVREVSNDMGGTVLQTLEDKSHEKPYYRSPLRFDGDTLPDHRLFSIGTIVETARAETVKFEQIVTHGTKIALCEVGNAAQRFNDYDLGYLVLGGKVILGE